MKRLARKLLLVVGIGVVAMAPLSAEAARGLYSWQGGDYSYDYASSYKIQVHDGEDDENFVRAEYRMELDGRIRYLYNYDGAKTSKFESLKTFPRAHRSVENLDYRPDAYGPWKYPK